MNSHIELLTSKLGAQCLTVNHSFSVKTKTDETFEDLFTDMTKIEANDLMLTLETF